MLWSAKPGGLAFYEEIIMARIFRHTYSKPLPKNSEVFIRKGKKYARFKNSKGKMITAGK